MYLSLAEIEVAMARNRELVATAERNVRLESVARSLRRRGTSPLRRSAGAALVRIGERLQGCPVPCGS